jgi:replicative DNA helicase
MSQLDDNSISRHRETTGRVPPSAIEAEESLLGAMLLSQDAAVVAAEILKAEDFYRPMNGHIFAAIVDLMNSFEPVDLVTVQARLQARGAGQVELAMLTALQINTPSTGNAERYARLVRDTAQQRRLISAGAAIVDEAYKPTDDVATLIDKAEALVNGVGEARSEDSYSDLLTLLLNQAEVLEKRGENRGQMNGLPTGFHSLDAILQGLQPTALTIVGARPGMGKTSFGLGILTHVGAVVKRPALYFSLEMGRQELAERILASTARIDSTKLRTGDLSEFEWNRTHDAYGYLSGAKIFIDDNPALTVLDVRARARRTKQENGDLGVIIIDYLQLMNSRGRYENRQVEVAEMSRSLKQLARELQVPVIALSQLSRKVEERTDKRPIMADLRESGSLEQDADVVLFLYRPEQYGEVSNDLKASAEVIVGKNRNGPTRSAHLTWRAEFARFDNVADPANI